MADERPIGFWLKLVDRLIDEAFDKTLDEHGVTRRQWQVLTLLGRGPATREELDGALAPFVREGVESTASQTDELVESEWVAATDSGFVLTPMGQLSFERLSEVVSGIRARLSAGLSEDDYEATVRSLERMSRNLGWAE
ncbi:MAG: MarR family transcriptional regulator [Burkholderiaceae bacterium]|nr:MarR family transcriptional regulator [Microbacteriaceae bacterium]